MSVRIKLARPMGPYPANFITHRTAVSEILTESRRATSKKRMDCEHGAADRWDPCAGSQTHVVARGFGAICL
jgi:hypothetical protein